MKEELRCPECLSDKLIKVGHVWSGRERKQQWRCNDCGRLTIKPVIINEARKVLVAKPA